MESEGNVWRVWGVLHRTGNDIIEDVSDFMLMNLEIYLRLGEVGDEMEMVVVGDLKRMNEEGDKGDKIGALRIELIMLGVEV
ncbi:hypothetical protein, partial [Bacillus altitudinis]|uniref:hypothetical protein n=1 Tax=Bacillus altitudinis TaxID=293387 RepID=UPI0011A33839